MAQGRAGNEAELIASSLSSKKKAKGQAIEGRQSRTSRYFRFFSLPLNLVTHMVKKQ